MKRVVPVGHAPSNGRWGLGCRVLDLYDSEREIDEEIYSKLTDLTLRVTGLRHPNDIHRHQRRCGQQRQHQPVAAPLLQIQQQQQARHGHQ